MHLVAPFKGVTAPDPAHGIAKVPVLILLLVRIHRAEIEASLGADRNAFSIDAVGNGDPETLRRVLLVGIVQGGGMQEIECRLVQQARTESISAGDTGIVKIDAAMAGDEWLDVHNPSVTST